MDIRGSVAGEWSWPPRGHFGRAALLTEVLGGLRSGFDRAIAAAACKSIAIRCALEAAGVEFISEDLTLVEIPGERRWPLKSWRRFDPVDVLPCAIDELGHSSSAKLTDILRASEVPAGP